MAHSMIKEGVGIRRRTFLKFGTALSGVMLFGYKDRVWGQTKKRISVATGGMGGVFYPIGGGIASIISKYMPGVEATAEVTAASVDNCKLVAAKNSDLALASADTTYDAIAGLGKFKEKLSIVNLAVLYPGYMHIVSTSSKGINSAGDLKGKRISTGAPGSSTEIIALRILEAYDLKPDKDVSRDRLGASESANALKDGKIDAYFWGSGIPAANVLDLAATPGTTVKLISHGDAILKMEAKYPKQYFKANIPKGIYPGVDSDVSSIAFGNLLIAHENMDTQMAYDVVKTVFEHLPELEAIHKEAKNISLKGATIGSPIPFHKGAVNFYKEKGMIIE